MNESGTIVGRSWVAYIFGGMYPETSLMLWNLLGSETNVYGAPTYLLPTTQLNFYDDIPDHLWFLTKPSIADDGSVSCELYYDEYGKIAWAVKKPIAGVHGNQMNKWLTVEEPVSYPPNGYTGALLDEQTGLFIKQTSLANNSPNYTLCYRNSGEPEILTGLLSNATTRIDNTDISKTPAAASASAAPRTWFSVTQATGDSVFLEKTSGGSGISRWHKPASMSEGAKKLNARGEAITDTKIWRNGTYTPLDNLVSKPANTQLTITKAIDLISNGIILAEANDNGVTTTGLLVPVEFEVKHTEKERDDEGNELATEINPGATTLLRDEIADLRIKVPTIGTADWDMKLELEPADMKTETLDSRGSVQMYDFGTVDPFGTITPLSVNGNGTTKAGPYDIKLLAANGGDETFKIVVNKEGKFKLRLKSKDNKVDVLSQEFTVTKRIRKYARRPENNNADFDRHDKAFVDAAEAWGTFYNNPLDPDILKAMGMQESTLGYGATPTADILTINYGGNDQDHVLAILHREHVEDGEKKDEKEAIPDGGNGWTIRWLDYDDAAAGSARVAIHWGTCWLFHKAQKGRFVSAPNSPPHYATFGGWNTWETAVGNYGPNPVYLGVIEGPWKRGRKDSTTDKVDDVWKKIDFAVSNFQYLWPILSNQRSRK